MKLRRLLTPEVVQTSAMDCGPACLKSLLEGFGIGVNYGRLREACQTDVDGTSINIMEDVAVELGLEAEQIMVPVDHLLVPAAKTIPAIVVVQLPNRFTHFVVAWNRFGGLIQLMDPVVGRTWSPIDRFLDRVYVHTSVVAADAWREWAGSEEFLSALQARLCSLEISRRAARRLICAAVADPGCRSIAALDAAVRMVRPLVESDSIKGGNAARRVVERLYQRAQDTEDAADVIPADYWSVQPASPATEQQDEQLLFRGAVLVRVRGRRKKSIPDSPSTGDEAPRVPLSPELQAALQQPSTRPALELLRLLRADGFLTPAALTAALALATGTVVFEVLMYRVFLDIARELPLTGQRVAAVILLIAFTTMMFVFDICIATGLLRFGRRLEARLRVLFLEKIPRLSDRYLHSRLTSDMAERCHAVHSIRALPALGGAFLASSFELALTTAGLVWLDPGVAPIAVSAALAAIVLPLVMQPVVKERDLRFRTHQGALCRFYLDSLRGLIPIRAHVAESAVRTEHESLLVDWAGAGISLQRIAVIIEGVYLLVATGFVAALVLSHLGHVGQSGASLLFVYWALNVPALGRSIAQAAMQYPTARNLTLRLLEPLGALEDSGAGAEAKAESGASPVPTRTERAQSVEIRATGVSVRAAGHTILEDVTLWIEPGSHLCIVGVSGAGKSSLVGLLLGWHRPADGELVVDGLPLTGPRLEKLRKETAWVDPAVQLWNRSLLENLRYGTPDGTSVPIGQLIEEASLLSVLEKLPDGLQTTLGEGGALVSGGEGQRVRLGRAMLRPGIRLVILDEPFSGLDRAQRKELLARVRRLWRGTTLLCITHDVSEAEEFERVVVVEGGRVIEDNAPAELLRQPHSRYRELLEAEESAWKHVWSSGDWRQLWLKHGRLVEKDKGAARAV